MREFDNRLEHFLASEKVLRGALAAGREKEGEFATTSLEFEYLHRKSRCEDLIGGDDVITLGTCFSIFVCIRDRFRLVLIGETLTAQSTGSHRGTGGGIQIPETVVAISPSFSCPSARAPQRARRRLSTFP